MISQVLLLLLQGILKSLGCGGWVAPNASKSPKARAKELPVASTLEQEPHVATWMQQIDSLQANRFSRCAQMLISWGCKVDARCVSHDGAAHGSAIMWWRICQRFNVFIVVLAQYSGA